MRKNNILITVVVLLLVVGAVYLSQKNLFSIISVPSLNPSFETDSGWQVHNYGAPVTSTGEYNNSWASDGLRSFHLKSGNYQSCVYQQIDIDNVNYLSFDFNKINANSTLQLIIASPSTTGTPCSGNAYYPTTTDGNTAVYNFNTSLNIKYLGIRLGPQGNAYVDNLILGTTSALPQCDYTYSAWGSDCVLGIQNRTVTNKTPETCVGNPILTKSCISLPNEGLVLNSARVDGSILTINYSKERDSCAVIYYSPLGTFNQGVNFLCTKGYNIIKIQDMTALGEMLEVGDNIKICDGNNGNICSNAVVVTGNSNGNGGNGTNTTAVTYYRSTTNCTTISLLPSLKTSNDYLTASSCQASIASDLVCGEDSFSLFGNCVSIKIFWIILGGVALFLLLKKK